MGDELLLNKMVSLVMPLFLGNVIDGGLLAKGDWVGFGVASGGIASKFEIVLFSQKDPTYNLQHPTHQSF